MPCHEVPEKVLSPPIKIREYPDDDKKEKFEAVEEVILRPLARGSTKASGAHIVMHWVHAWRRALHDTLTQL